MNVTMMNVREMRVCVSHRRMLMRMSVRFFAVPLEVVNMPVVLVVPMPMVVVQCFVRVGMFMPLTDMKPDSQSHECGSGPEQQRRHFRPQDER